MDPLTTSESPATDPEGIVTDHELRVPTSSEAATDPRPTSESTDIGLIVGIVVIVIVVIAAVVTVVVIMAVLFKRRGKMVLDEKRALSNPVYSSKGQSTTYCTVHYLLVHLSITPPTIPPPCYTGELTGN